METIEEQEFGLNYVFTNADRIRSMTDKELAGFISSQIIDRNIGVPVESWLDWLKREYKVWQDIT